MTESDLLKNIVSQTTGLIYDVVDLIIDYFPKCPYCGDTLMNFDRKVNADGHGIDKTSSHYVSFYSKDTDNNYTAEEFVKSGLIPNIMSMESNDIFCSKTDKIFVVMPMNSVLKFKKLSSKIKIVNGIVIVDKKISDIFSINGIDMFNIPFLGD